MSTWPATLPTGLVAQIPEYLTAVEYMKVYTGSGEDTSIACEAHLLQQTTVAGMIIDCDFSNSP
jgi:hypothetical protein